jgi:hypothetical protein
MTEWHMQPSSMMVVILNLTNTSFEVVLETTQGNDLSLLLEHLHPHPLFGPNCLLAHPTNNVNYSLVTTNKHEKLTK